MIIEPKNTIKPQHIIPDKEVIHSYILQYKERGHKDIFTEDIELISIHKFKIKHKTGNISDIEVLKLMIEYFNSTLKNNERKRIFFRVYKVIETLMVYKL